VQQQVFLFTVLSASCIDGPAEAVILGRREVATVGVARLGHRTGTCQTVVHTEKGTKKRWVPIYSRDMGCQAQNGKTDATQGAQNSKGREELRGGCAIHVPVWLDSNRKLRELTGTFQQSNRKNL
jgi:hypothetical protein